jgi:Ribbon-helix-helix domain
VSPNLKPATFRIDRRLLDALEEVKRRDGVPISEQVRRALEAWLEGKGVLEKSDRSRAQTRKRS